MKLHIDYIVSGVVQGVGYRYFAYKHACELNLSGFARNNFDGTVSISAEGDETALTAYLNYLREGPSRARVQKVNQVVSGYTGLFTGFEIR